MVGEPGEIQDTGQGCSAEESRGLQEDRGEDLGACRQERQWAVGAGRNLDIVSFGTARGLQRCSTGDWTCRTPPDKRERA